MEEKNESRQPHPKDFSLFLEETGDLQVSDPFEDWPETELADACKQVYNCKKGQNPVIPIDGRILEDEFFSKDIRSFKVESLDFCSLEELLNHFQGMINFGSAIVSVLVKDRAAAPTSAQMDIFIHLLPEDTIWGLAFDDRIPANYHADILIYK